MNTNPLIPRRDEASLARPKRGFDSLRLGLLTLIAPAVLVACGDPAPTPPNAMANEAIVVDIAKDRAVTSGSADDPSVPSADSAVTPARGDAQAIEGPALTPLTTEEESQAMPKDGQANDHSSPKMGS